ncbi:type II toxin-antitoxin system HicB family antitoxin [Alicyclobacillaceae bacterium I2511]|jgi:predicted RNase H-like HicB family nuclease|nr:type II toxin-antitoxin system HicB family antitoxin [Alicyclobacillaceae bacterium I2511]
MNKYVFPAVFDPAEKGESGYTVTFPDLPGCITEGDTIEEALANAREAMELWLWDTEQHGELIPVPSDPKNIQLKKGKFVMLVIAWMDLIRDEMANKSIKKTLTLPKWLNDAAEKQQLNFSQLLQFALKERLGIIEPQPGSSLTDEISTTMERQSV